MNKKAYYFKVLFLFLLLVNRTTFSMVPVDGDIDTAITFDSFPGIDAQAMAMDGMENIYVVGAGQSVVRYATTGLNSGKITLTFTNFPGVSAKSLTLIPASPSGLPSSMIVVGAAGSVVQYNTVDSIVNNVEIKAGTIKLVYDSFPGVVAQAVTIDPLDTLQRIIVVGVKSSVVRYSTAGTQTGAIETTFDAFPGISANSISIDSLSRVLVGGYSGTIVRYNGTGASAGSISTTFSNFAGTVAQSLVIDGTNKIVVVGFNGSIVQYNASGSVDTSITFDTFPGQDAVDAALDDSGRLIVVGRAGSVVRYSMSGNTAGQIEKVFTSFPGIGANALVIVKDKTSANYNKVIVAGKQGTIVRYYNL